MRCRARWDDRSSKAFPRPLYDEDFALWMEEQVAALRAGDVAALKKRSPTAERQAAVTNSVIGVSKRTTGPASKRPHVMMPLIQASTRIPCKWAV